MSREVKIGTISRIKYKVSVTREEYIKHCEGELIKAGQKGCDIVLLPEWFDVFGSSDWHSSYDGLYSVGVQLYEMAKKNAEPIPGLMTDRLGKIAKEYNMYIIANYIELAGEKLYNTAVIIGRKGKICGKYRKTHLAAIEKRNFGIDVGNELPVFDLDFGRIGILICMDIMFPELFRILTLKGAEIIFWPHQTYGPSEESLEIYVRSKSMDYNCFMVTSNYASPKCYAPYERGHEMTGRSVIVNRDGLIIADTGHYPGIAMAEIDLDVPKMSKDMVSLRRAGYDYPREDLLMMRRPELYHEIVKPIDNSAALEGKFID